MRRGIAEEDVQGLGQVSGWFAAPWKRWALPARAAPSGDLSFAMVWERPRLWALVKG